MARTPRTAKKGTSVSARPAWPDRFLQELRTYGAILPTARAVGVGRTTVYDEFKRNPDFKAEVNEILTECVEIVEQSLYQAAQLPGREGTTDRIFFLKTRKPEVYADKLNPLQVQQIRQDARREVVEELQDEIARLPKAAREVVMAAMRRTAEKELNA